jgi:hypothetical protein
MGVAVDETGDQISPLEINDPFPLAVFPDAGYQATMDRDLAKLDLAGEDVHHPAIGKEEIGGKVPTGNGDDL